MRVAGQFRAVRQRDHAVPAIPPRPLSPRGGALDVRIWLQEREVLPWLLVTASRKHGAAVQRNCFRRRVRMAFLDVLRESPPESTVSLVCWVRPGKGTKLDPPPSYELIKGQLLLALSRWIQP